MNEQVAINSLEFAEKSLEIHGTIAPFALKRLADWLHSGDGALHYRLRGGISARGLPQLMLDVQGGLNLVCQRCLGPVDFKLDAQTSFVLVLSEDDLPSPEEERDDEEYLVADPHLQVELLVEEEVLLALPLAPRHEGEGCIEAPAVPKEHKDSPFSVLKGLAVNKR